MNFHLALVYKCPADECFREVMLTVGVALHRLGHTVTWGDNLFRTDGTNIVFCFWRNPHAAPPNSIIYNLEPIVPERVADGRVPLQELRRFPVWDYSPQNVAELRSHGICATCVPIGYVPELTRIKPQKEDLDVFLYGALTERRITVIQTLGALGLKVFASQSVYGAKRDALIARARVVLNLHSESAIRALETVRISYLLANQRAIVTELNEGDDFPEAYRGGLFDSSYQGLVDTTLLALGDDDQRRNVAQRGFELFSQLDECEILQSVIGENTCAA